MTLKRLLVLALLLMLSSTALAQSDTITFGSFNSGSLDTETPARFYSFEGTENDLISIEAITLSGGLDPRISLLSATSTSLAVNSDDPFQPGSRDARLTFRLPETASYSVLVEAEDRTTGQFLLRLERLDPLTPQALPVGIITNATLTPDVNTQAYSFDSAQATTVSVTSTVRGFAFIMEVRSPDGETIAVQGGDLIQQASTSVADNSGTYTLVLRAANAGVQGTLEVLFSGEAAAPPQTVQADTSPEVGAEAATEPEPTTAPVVEGEGSTETAESDDGSDAGDDTGASTVGADVPDNRCTVIAPANGVIIRQGPSTSFPQISSIPGNDFRFADATDGVWIRLVGGGWVSSGVVELNGPCGGLPVISVATSPNQPAEAQPTATVVAPVGSRAGG